MTRTTPNKTFQDRTKDITRRIKARKDDFDEKEVWILDNSDTHDGKHGQRLTSSQCTHMPSFVTDDDVRRSVPQERDDDAHAVAPVIPLADGPRLQVQRTLGRDD